MKKLIAGIVAGVAVLALTLITLLLDPSTFLTQRWKGISVSIASLALLAIVAQAIWTKQDEDAEKKRARAETEALSSMLEKILSAVLQRQNELRIPSTSEDYQKAAKAYLILHTIRDSAPESDEIPAHWRLPHAGSLGEKVRGWVPPKTPTVSRKEALEDLQRSVTDTINTFLAS